MRSTLKGKKDVRTCKDCNWCPAGAPQCAWRLGLYSPELSPPVVGMVLHPTRIAGKNCFVVQPFREDIPAAAAPVLAKMAEYNPVVLTTAPVWKGGIVQAILAPTDEIAQTVATALDFGPKDQVVAEVVAQDPEDPTDQEGAEEQHGNPSDDTGC